MGESQEQANAEANPKVTPQSLVKEEHVKIALAAQCGKDAILRTWAVHDFATKGDNYACIVSSVMVTYMLHEQKHWTSFIVKLNPCRPLADVNNMTHNMFKKEGNFYQQIIPDINAALRSVKQTELRVPKCYYVCYKEHEEVIYLEDLRDQGYKMADRRMGLDVPHLILVLTELGRLHAASVILRGNKTSKELYDTYPHLEELFLRKEILDVPEMKQFAKLISDSSVNMITAVEGYDNFAAYLKELDIFGEATKELVSSPPFEVISHGDCWTNNFLFRYDEHGSPVEVRLLDLQITRLGSPALDINYLLFSSAIGEIRKQHLDTLLSAYLSKFDSVLACGGRKPEFTFEQLREEYFKRNKFGLCMGLMLIPMMVASQEEVMDLDSLTEDAIEKFMIEDQEKKKKAMKNNPLLKPRLLDMIDELIERGVIQN